MTNDEARMTNDGQNLRWSFGFRHSSFIEFLSSSSALELLLLLRLFLRVRLTILAAYHRNATGTDKLQDAVGPHPLDERFDFAFAAGDFNHQLFRTNIDDLGAKYLDQFANFRPLGPRRSSNLEQH